MKFVCPRLDRWEVIDRRLCLAWEDAGKKGTPPPTPLILAGWCGSNDYEKGARWRETAEWAERYGFDHFTPELSPEEIHSVTEMSPYYLGPTGKPMKLRWKSDPKKVPSPEEVDQASRKLNDGWETIVGTDLAKITSPQGFFGANKRRLVVRARMSADPPWGSWTSLAPDERRRSFTQFREAISKAIAPLEVDHIDFVPLVPDEKGTGVAPFHGFYLWGRYEANGLWRNIYLGKAGFGKTAHLRARILEELKDERACIWAEFVSEKTLRVASRRNHPKMCPVYDKHMVRALRKTGTTHIAWVADPELSNSAVENIESDLIETLNPAANVSHPVPPVSLQQHTKQIIAEFRSLVHRYRSDRYRLTERRRSASQ